MTREPQSESGKSDCKFETSSLLEKWYTMLSEAQPHGHEATLAPKDQGTCAKLSRQRHRHWKGGDLLEESRGLERLIAEATVHTMLAERVTFSNEMLLNQLSGATHGPLRGVGHTARVKSPKTPSADCLEKLWALRSFRSESARES